MPPDFPQDVFCSYGHIFFFFFFFLFFTPRIFMSKTEARRFLSWVTEFVSRHRSLLWLQPLCPCGVHWQFVKVITRRHHRSVQASSSLYRECGMETEYDCYSIYSKATISNVNPNTMWLFKALAACVTHPGWGKLLLDLWCVRKHDIMLTSWPPLKTGWEPPPCSNSSKHFC